MEDEIKAESKRSGFAIENERVVLNKCLTFCINYKLSPLDLVSNWEVYYLNRQLDGSAVRNAEMDGFLLHLQNEKRDAIIKEEPYLHVYYSRDVDMILSGEQEDLIKLQDHVDYLGSETRVLLVPSVRDANHDFVFRQAPFDTIPSNLRDQVNVGCCTIDIPKQLSGEEISRLGDRLSRLTTHLLNQHSFYPFYPPAESVPLDLSIAPEALDIPMVPQILILPSDLTPFIKFVSIKEKETKCKRAAYV